MTTRPRALAGRGLRTLVPGTVSVLAVLLLWSYGSRHVSGNGLLLPSPTSVARSLVDDAWMIFPALRITVVNALWGLLWGTFVGVGVAVLGSSLPPLRPLLTRQLVLVYCLPLASIAPLLFLLSSTPGPEIIMGAIATVFPIYSAVLQGLSTPHPDWEDMTAVLGGSRLRYFLKVQLPAATGHFLLAARLAIPAAVLGVTLAEYFGGDQGIGALMITSISTLEAARAYALGIVITVVCSLGYVLLGVLGRLFPWIGEVADA